MLGPSLGPSVGMPSFVCICLHEMRVLPSLFVTYYENLQMRSQTKCCKDDIFTDLFIFFLNFVGLEVSIAMAPSTKSQSGFSIRLFGFLQKINPVANKITFKTYYANLRFIILFWVTFSAQKHISFLTLSGAAVLYSLAVWNPLF